MRFACPKCNTRYNVADDKLPRGKTVRFTCKSCNNNIRLKVKDKPAEETGPIPQLSDVDAAAPTRVATGSDVDKLKRRASEDFGEAATRVASDHEVQAVKKASVEDTGFESPAATRVAESTEIDRLKEQARPNEDTGWFVLVGGEQTGPMNAHTVEEKLTRDEINVRTYVWRDGMADWKRLEEVRRFKSTNGDNNNPPWQDQAAPTDGPDPELDKPTVAIPKEEIERSLEAAKKAATTPESAPADEIDNEAETHIERITLKTDPSLVESSEVHPVAPFEEAPAPEPAPQSVDDPGGPNLGFAAPIGEQTRLFLAKSGMFARRRNHRIAAVLGTVFGIAFVTIISLDIAGVYTIPGMGMFYDYTGLQDPNVGRAVERLETADRALTPGERQRLEALRAQLMGGPEKEGKRKKNRPKKGAEKAKPEGQTEEGLEGAKEELGNDERALAEAIFSDQRKQESELKLAKPDEIQAPNLPQGLTQEAIYKVITDNSKSMKLCVAEASRKGDNIQGRMEIALTIGADGTVRDAEIETRKFKDSAIGQCTLKRVKNWRFPRFNGEPVTVVFPYILQMAF